MKRKTVVVTLTLMALALSCSFSPVYTISPLLPHTMLFQGQVGGGYVGGGSPIIKPANGMAFALVRDEPQGQDRALVVAFGEIPADNVRFVVRLVTLHTADPVRFYDDYMILWGYFDVYVNGVLAYNDEYGYFTFNWTGGFWGLLVGTPVTDVLAYTSGSALWYTIW